MDVRHLRNFLAVATAGSINKASVDIGVSQPALTKSIQRLEAEIGVPLFTREAKGVRPTIYAQQLSAFARSTCVGFDQSIKEIRALKSGSSGEVTLCGPPFTIGHLLPETALRVNRAFPGLRLRIIEQTDGLVESLLKDEFELVMVTIDDETLDAGLHCLSLLDDDLIVIARRGHAVGRLKSLSAKNLARFDWIFPNPGNLHRRRLEQYFESERIALPRPTLETSSPALIKSIVLQTDRIALMPRMGAQAELDAGTLDGVKIKSPLMVRTIGLLWRSSHPLSAAAGRVVDTICAICEERGHRPKLLPTSAGERKGVAHHSSSTVLKSAGRMISSSSQSSE